MLDEQTEKAIKKLDLWKKLSELAKGVANKELTAIKYMHQKLEKIGKELIELEEKDG